MILLLGGTSETRHVAEALAQAGHRVLVSTATDVPLNVGRNAHIRRRCGRLNAEQLAELVRRERIAAIVDVSHPYATELRATAERVAQEAGIPYWTYVRPGSAVAGEGVKIVSSHAQAAQIACQALRTAGEFTPRFAGSGRGVLLTIGSGNVAVYAQEAQRRKVPARRWVKMLIARVLPHEASIAACLRAGIPREQIVTGRGPFSLEENRALIRRFGVGVLVTKDSGAAGGFQAKQEAARLEGCLLVVVGRSAQPRETRGKLSGRVFNNPRALVQAVLAAGLTDRNLLKKVTVQVAYGTKFLCAPADPHRRNHGYHGLH